MSGDHQESLLSTGDSINSTSISAYSELTPCRNSIPQHEMVSSKEEGGTGIVTTEASVCSVNVCLNEDDAVLDANHDDGIPPLQSDTNSTDTINNTDATADAKATPTMRQLLMRKHHSTSGRIEETGGIYARRNYHGITEANPSASASNAASAAKPNNTSSSSNPGSSIAVPNYCIHSDLDDSSPSPLPVIVDSHTSYRKIIDDEITKLKFQLTKAQSVADSLEHELKKRNLSYMLLEEQFLLVKRQRLESTKQLHQLETVVSHLQDHARESALARANLTNQHVELNEECLSYQHASKKYKGECRKLRKEVDSVRQDLEGRCMENQGLKSEIDWLKKQLWPGKVGGEETDSDFEAKKRDLNGNLNGNSHGAINITGIKQFLSPLSPPSYQRRRRRRKRSVATASAKPAYQQSQSAGQEHEKEHEQKHTTDGEEAEGGMTLMPLIDDSEDRTTGYTSLTDFKLKSASESGIDIAHVNTRDKVQKSSFISKLALRHGISTNPNDSKSAQSYRSMVANVGNVGNMRAESRAARKAARKVNLNHSHLQSSSSFKSVAVDSRRPSFKSALSKLSLHETDREDDEDKDTANVNGDGNANAAPWSIWGILSGSGVGVSSKPDHTQGEDKTKELSDYSHSSEEFIQHLQRPPVHTSKHIGTGTGTKMETKPSSVLVPKRLSSV